MPLRKWVESANYAIEGILPAVISYLNPPVLIAQSRVSVGIHRPWEVILGALLGSVVAFLVFKILS
ncbi:MAG: phosphatase PAP2 family protein [Thermodesulfovibrionia bacterium]